MSSPALSLKAADSRPLAVGATRSTVGRITLVNSAEGQNGWHDGGVKPLADKALAAVLFVLFVPVVLLAAAAVRLTSRGPAFYAQTRTGRAGRPFRILKLRTMYHECENHSGPRWSVPGDDRITPVGRFLRRSHIDELPQLVNVLLGHMSLVGPRPERPELIPGLEKGVAGYRDRLAVRPGVTGLAQLCQPADTTLDCVRRKLAYDRYYIAQAGPWMDIVLMIGTAAKMFGLSPVSVCRMLGLSRPELAPDRGDRAMMPTLTPSTTLMEAVAARPTRSVTRIGPKPRWQIVDVAELWVAREVLFQLARRDVSVRFKQTILGVAWAVVPAVTTMLVFAVFLGRLGNLSQGDPTYPLFVLAGTLPWAFFSTAVAASGNSLLNNQGLVTKVYFPRLILPMAAFGTPLVDLCIGFVLLFAMMAWFGVVPGAGLVVLPLAAAALALSAAGVGILLSALIVAQRDFRFLLGLGLQLWMFATPCIYLNPASFSETTQAWLPLNPAYGPILAFRAATLGGPVDWSALGVSAAVGAAVLVLGLWYFRRTERSFADVI